ncbi:MAG TPA: TonB-dependent receptor, partial [Chromatiaceae bacterium]|nr:TonB-dependent receptor [Chromatiaceae bacterium]
VENFGTLSGTVTVTTREPERGFHSDVDLSVGSWEHFKGAATLTGGGDRIRALATISLEESNQYKDGDGNDFAEQIKAYDPNTPAGYQPLYDNLKAYEKNSFLGKLDFDITADQVLKLSYTANRSDEVLYPSSPMDALYDDSDLFTLNYGISRLGQWSEELNFEYYYSSVDHPMSNLYRLSSGPDSANEKIHHLKTKMQGAKIKNRMTLSDGTMLLVGLDFSRRNWDGKFEGKGMASMIDGFVSIDDVDTTNRAIFVEAEKSFANVNLRIGARYDDTSIEPAGKQPSNDYTGFGAFVFGTWAITETSSLFAGIGRSQRVPDARELYIRMPVMGGMTIGNPDLDQTTNHEIDLGMEMDSDQFYLKAKVFYSWLDNFIFYNDSKGMYRFENMDATLYGFSIDGNWSFTDNLYLDFGLAYQRGRKDDPLVGQTDTDMPEIPPLKGNLALNWEYMPKSLFRAELIASDSWTNYDEDNGEQALDAWTVLNLNVRHQLTGRIVLLGGIDNVFDETYAVSNTYKDLTLIEAGGNEVILMNEPGRYFYLNATYSF